MDISQLSQLPLTVLVILGAYWVIQRLNDQHAKQIVALATDFLEKYQAVVKRSDEDREDSRQRWLERDRQLIATLVSVEKAMAENSHQDHSLRTSLQPLVLWWQREQRSAGRPTRQGDDVEHTG